MNKLAKDLGIELKPFCVRSDEFPSAQICQDHLDRCVSLGAVNAEFVLGTQRIYDYDTGYSLAYLEVWGIDKDLETVTFYLRDNQMNYRCELLSYKQMLEYLQLTEKDGRLVPNEDLGDSREPPVSSSEPVSMIKGRVVPAELERLLELIVGEFTGDRVEHSDSYLSEILGCVSDILGRPEDHLPRYALSSEVARNNLDKQIEEAENNLLEAQNKLDELKKQREVN